MACTVRLGWLRHDGVHKYLLNLHDKKLLASSLVLNKLLVNLNLNKMYQSTYIPGRRGAVAQAYECKRDGCGFDSHSEEYIIIY